MASTQSDFLDFYKAPDLPLLWTQVENTCPRIGAKKGERIQEVTEHRGQTWWEDESWMITIRRPRHLPALYHLAREQRQQRQLRGLLLLRIKFLAGSRQSCLLAIVLDDRCDGLGMFDNL